MKAFEISNALGIDGLTLVERDEPQLGHGQVLVRVRSVSLNHRDLGIVKSAGAGSLRLPLIPCSDGAGEVMKIGSGITRFKPGDRVAGIFFQTWLAGEPKAAYHQSALGGAIDGMLAEKVVLHEDGLVHVPAHLTYEEAASLPCAAVTAWHALITRGGLKVGDTVLVQGTGGVSIFALQFAGMGGARVIVTSSSDAKLKRARQLGAVEGINYKTTPDWDEEVLKLTAGVGVDHVVEVGGAATLAKSVRAVRVGGTISVIGGLTGFGEVSPGSLHIKSARMHGIYVGSRQMFETMNQAIAMHKMQPFIDRVFPFDQTPDAFRYMDSAAHFGKIVIAL